jgi:ABC-2 type transport system permease protein
MAIPVRFVPHWLREVSYGLPFTGVLQTPVDVWLGKRAGLELVSFLALQALWACVLLALGRVALAFGTRKLVVQGG